LSAKLERPTVQAIVEARGHTHGCAGRSAHWSFPLLTVAR
jgi:hypothetical protein